MAELDKKPVLIDGATGYVGSNLTARLCAQQYEVRCLVHKGASALDVDFLKGSGARVYTADLNKNDIDLSPAMAGVRTAVHLIGSIAPRKGQPLEDLHVVQTRNFVDRCRKHGIKKVVMVTALGAGPDAVSVYHRTKWQAEQCLAESGLSYVILRPSLLVGRLTSRRDSKLVARLIDLIQTRNAVPLVKGGSNRIQPLFVGDLLQVLQACIEQNQLQGQVLELGGPQILTMKELLTELMQVMQISKKIIDLPPGLAYVLATICEFLQPVPMISQDQVKLSLQDNVCKQNALESVLGAAPTDLKQALMTYVDDAQKLVSCIR